MKSSQKITLLVVAIFIAVGAFYYILFSGLFQETPPVSGHSYLELNIVGDIKDRSEDDPVSKMLFGEMPSMEGLLANIRKAAIDQNIDGIILRPFISSIGWAQAEELRDALKNFRASGKKVYVYLEMAGNKEYYLAAAGDMIFGPPEGILLIDGITASTYFLKGSLDKLGIDAQVVAYGKYKNAPDMFTRKNMSDAQKEVTNSILDDYYGRYIKEISADRGISENDLRDAVDYGLYSLRDAYAKKLVDTLLYYNDFKDYLKKDGNRRLRIVSYSRYNKVSFGSLGVHAKETIAIVYGSGDIVSGIGENVSPENMITSESMANSIRKAAENDRIKAIVLRINSPGGSSTAADIIWREVVKAREKKPVIVSMSDMAASGGYYISMAADTIVAEPSSLVGSIGVFSWKFNFNGLYDKLGVDKDAMHRGKNADLFSENQNYTSAQREIMTTNIMNFYKVFVTKVAEGRHMSYEAVNDIAQGRVWTGAEGLKNGLVDKLGGLKEAVEVAKEMTGIPETDFVNVISYPEQVSFVQRLLSSEIQAKTHPLIKMIPKNLRLYLGGIFIWQDYEPLMLMPFYVDVR